MDSHFILDGGLGGPDQPTERETCPAPTEKVLDFKNMRNADVHTDTPVILILNVSTITSMINCCFCFTY